MAAAKKKQGTQEAETLTIDDLKEMQKDLSKELGTDLFFGDDSKFTLRKLPLGIAPLDAALNGGLAFDRIAVVVGEFSAGKTLIAMLAMKAAQAQGLTCAFIDVEKTWTPEWARQLGVDPERVLIIRPRTAEDAFNAAVALVRRRIPLLVVDSLAAMRSETELEVAEDEMFQKSNFGTAKLIGRGLSSINAENKGTCVICINQLREKPGVVYGNPETMPGGKAPGFYAWQLIRVRRGAFIEEGDKKVGYKLKVVIQKNKQGAPFKEGEVPFYYTGVIDEIAGLVEQAIEIGAVEQQGGWYTIRWPSNDGEALEERVYGRRRLIDTVKDRPDIKEGLERRVGAIEEVDL